MREREWGRKSIMVCIRRLSSAWNGRKKVRKKAKRKENENRERNGWDRLEWVNKINDELIWWKKICNSMYEHKKRKNKYCLCEWISRCIHFVKNTFSGAFRWTLFNNELKSFICWEKILRMGLYSRSTLYNIHIWSDWTYTLYSVLLHRLFNLPCKFDVN